MEKRLIDETLKSKIKSYLKSMNDAGLNDDQDEEKKIISKLTPNLQQQLNLSGKGRIFQKIPIIQKNFSAELILKLIDRMREIRMSPGEILMKDQFDFIYIMKGEIQLIFR